MKCTIDIEKDRIVPGEPAIRAYQQVPPDVPLSGKVKDLFIRAEQLFLKDISPCCHFLEISREQFLSMFPGSGSEISGTPAGELIHHSSRCSLFAVTIGEAVSRTISALFDSGDYALASIVDSYASAGIEKAEEILEQFFSGEVCVENPAWTVAKICPGLCGWELSGQEKIFELLGPAPCITLSEHYMMTPIKSISGVFLAGDFASLTRKNAFDCCKDCGHCNCLYRKNH